jgi:nucleotide-binding universal stress UspA family protein
MKSILVPIDGSDPSIRALSFAAQIARSVDAKIDLLYVFDDWNEILASLSIRSGKDLDDAVERVSKKRLDEAVDRAELAGIPVSRHHRVGHPASEIVTFAEASQPYLIVLGSRGRSTLEQLVVGSVSLKVLHRSQFPVTVVR